MEGVIILMGIAVAFAVAHHLRPHMQARTVHFKPYLEAAGWAVFGLAMIAVIAVIMAFPERWLWNSVMPEMFGLKEINLGQMICLSLLCTLLIKGMPSSTKKD
jgi:hypothetical protein